MKLFKTILLSILPIMGFSQFGVGNEVIYQGYWGIGVNTSWNIEVDKQEGWFGLEPGVSVYLIENETHFRATVMNNFRLLNGDSYQFLFRSGSLYDSYTGLPDVILGAEFEHYIGFMEFYLEAGAQAIRWMDNEDEVMVRFGVKFLVK